MTRHSDMDLLVVARRRGPCALGHHPAIPGHLSNHRRADVHTEAVRIAAAIRGAEEQV